MRKASHRVTNLTTSLGVLLITELAVLLSQHQPQQLCWQRSTLDGTPISIGDETRSIVDRRVDSFDSTFPANCYCSPTSRNASRKQEPNILPWSYSRAKGYKEALAYRIENSDARSVNSFRHFFNAGNVL